MIFITHTSININLVHIDLLAKFVNLLNVLRDRYELNLYLMNSNFQI
jgi:hypothetical protein